MSAASVPSTAPATSPVSTEKLTVDAEPPAPEYHVLSVQCANTSPLPYVQGPPRACILRGRIQAVRRIVLENPAMPPTVPPASARAIEMDVAPDDSIPCSTPFDKDAKGTRLPEADYPDFVRATRMHILGGERIASAFVEGKGLCGWTRMVGQPGLGYPYGWEGELFDEAGVLLGVHSFYFHRSYNSHLARAWRFSREGKAQRIHSDDAIFVEHEAVRIYHGGKSVVSKAGAEAELKGTDGTFLVKATSNLTEGQTPVYVGKHDGIFFSAIRSTP